MKCISLPAALGIALLDTTLAAQSLPVARPAAQHVVPAGIERMHTTLQRFVDDGQHAGLIVALARDGKLVDLWNTGQRDVAQKLPMQPDTICRIYSMSKIITSVGVLCLLEDGRFRLDDAVTNYLPELRDLQVMTGGTADAPTLEALKRAVTIKHLLTHTSGLAYDFDGADDLHQLYQRAKLWDGSSLKEFAGKVGRLPLKHQPGDQFTYGINCDVLGALIERVSGKTFEEFLGERIFTPLAMRDTSFDVPPEKMARLARTYKHGADGRFVEAEPLVETWPEKGHGLASGGAGLFTTIGDYLRFAQMLANGGALNGKRVLSRKTVELMTANHLLSLPEQAHAFSRAQGFGLGVEVQLDLGRGALPGSPGAFGWYGAATTYCRIDPKEHTVALLFAQHFPFNEHRIFETFATAYYSALE